MDVALRVLSRTFLLPVAVSYAALSVIKHFVKRAPKLAERGSDDDGHELLSVGGDETVLWLTVWLEKAWMQYAAVLEDLLLEAVYPIMVESKPDMLPPLFIGNIVLGTEAPRLVSAKTFSSVDPSTLVFDAVIEWSPPDNDITVQSSLIEPEPVLRATGLSLRSRVRITVRLEDKGVGEVDWFSISIIGKPSLKISIFPFSSALDLLSGSRAEQWIEEVLRYLIEEDLVFPNSLVVPISEKAKREAGYDDSSTGKAGDDDADNRIVDDWDDDDDDAAGRREGSGMSAFPILKRVRLVKKRIQSAERLHKISSAMNQRKTLEFNKQVRKEIVESASGDLTAFLLVKIMEGVNLGGDIGIGNFTSVVRVALGTETRSSSGRKDHSSRNLTFNERLYIPVHRGGSDLLSVSLITKYQGRESLRSKELVLGSAWLSLCELREGVNCRTVWVSLSNLNRSPTGEVRSQGGNAAGSLQLFIEYKAFNAGADPKLPRPLAGDEVAFKRNQGLLGEWEVCVLESTVWLESADFFCEVRCRGAAESTRTVKSTRRPLFGERFSFGVRNVAEDGIWFELYQTRMLHAPEVVGAATLWLSGNKSKPTEEFWVPLIPGEDTSERAWLRIWAGYRSFESTTDDSKECPILVNPMDRAANLRVERQERMFQRRRRDVESTKEPEALKALERAIDDALGEDEEGDAGEGFEDAPSEASSVAGSFTGSSAAASSAARSSRTGATKSSVAGSSAARSSRTGATKSSAGAGHRLANVIRQKAHDVKVQGKEKGRDFKYKARDLKDRSKAAARTGADVMAEKVKMTTRDRPPSQNLGLALAAQEGLVGKSTKPTLQLETGNKVPVLLTVVTSDEDRAATEGPIWISIIGLSGGQSPMEVITGNKRSFQRGCKDVFCVRLPEQVFPVSKLTIGHEGNPRSEWKLDRIELEPLGRQRTQWKVSIVARRGILASSRLEDGLSLDAVSGDT